MSAKLIMAQFANLIFKKGEKKMKNILSKIKFFLFLTLLLPSLSFAAGDSGNIASKLAGEAKTQIETAGSAVATIINTISVVMGAIWLIALLLMAFFAMEQIKQHAKFIFGAIVIIGIVYGLSKAYM